MSGRKLKVCVVITTHGDLNPLHPTLIFVASDHERGNWMEYLKWTRLLQLLTECPIYRHPIAIVAMIVPIAIVIAYS